MPSVLLVDDNTDLVELYTIVLTGKGYKTFAAYGGEECLALLKTTLPDLVLLDIMMEPMDGWETLTRIRSDIKTQSIPVIMVTGKKPTWDEIRNHMHDIEDYVVKPLTISALSDLVKSFFPRQQVIEHEIAIAKGAGADEVTLIEYRQLRRSLSAGLTMQKIIGQREESIEISIKTMKERFYALQHQYGIKPSEG
ncbi:MAG: response regulator [Methanoregula sp.]|jgi:DNA-binding response OmpR family regulator|nr:response regulator [Methanoregula sp.]